MQAIPGIRPVETVDDAIAAVKRVLDSGKHREPVTWVKAYHIAQRLMDVAVERLTSLGKKLADEITDNRTGFQFSTEKLPFHEPEQVTVFLIQAKQHGAATKQASFDILARPVGSRFRGWIEMVLVFDGPGSREAASQQPFQTNYAESYEDAERRFIPWLEESLVSALTLWRKTL